MKFKSLSLPVVLAVCAVAVSSPAVAVNAGSFNLIDQFRTIDVNGDSNLSLEEISAWRERSFAKLDGDKDNFLDFEEYISGQLTGAQGAELMLKKMELQSLFMSMDEDEDGEIERAQFVKHSAVAFLSADVDGDGQLSVPEFANSSFKS